MKTEILIKTIIFYFQRIIYYFALALSKLYYPAQKKPFVIIGLETANLLKLYAKIFNAFSININHNPSYSNKYNLDFSKFSRVIQLLVLPFLFPFFIKKFDSFWYLSLGAFFVSADGRLWEHSVLKKNNIKIASFFMGSDIRSYVLAREAARNINFDHHSFYLDQNISNHMIAIIDLKSKKYSHATDLHADYVFNLAVDNISYIKKDVYMPPLPVERNLFNFNQAKWSNQDNITILHCPSYPVLKGTQLVNAAIKKLVIEGYKFDFTLLTGVPHADVLEALDRSHIVLNEFYCFSPGIFGIEALEANCLLFTSASQEIEPGLFDGSDQAWVPTYYWQVYDNLKFYLDNFHLAQAKANIGTTWAKTYCSHESTKSYVESIMNIKKI